MIAVTPDELGDAWEGGKLHLPLLSSLNGSLFGRPNAGVDMTFGNVGESAWQDTGAVLAMTISAAERVGNGVQIYDAATGNLRVLESAGAQYLGLAWRRDAADLLVMRGKTDDKKDGSTYLTIAWTGVGEDPG